MGQMTAFLKIEREVGKVRSEFERINDFGEFHERLSLNKQRNQAARCMDCGVAFCQNGNMISGMMSGCPLHNLIPEMNDLVYRGRMGEAYYRLSMTHSFPEFTSRVCPALCEAACTCGLHDEAISIKENEKAVIEYAFENGLVEEKTPQVRTGKRVAVVGSGPSGLAVCQLLNRRGHEVTVYERNDRVGGLLRYGIPNMKLDKSVIDRRVKLLENAGVKFICNVNVGKDIHMSELKKQYDAVVLACGASKARDINAPGRDATGIYFAVDFLTNVTKKLLDSNFKNVPYELVKDKNVVIIGGGDTGNDCVATSIRLKAKSVTQLEMMPQPPKTRLESNAWPEWPKVLKVDYGQEESIYKFGKDPRVYQVTVKEFIKDKKGSLKEVVLISLEAKKDPKTGRISMLPIDGTEKKIPADIVLIAAGFLGTEAYIVDDAKVEVDARTNVKTAIDGHKTSVDGVFTAGDMHLGQSLVVRAIAEGRACAKEVDEYLMGYSNL